MPIPFLTQLRMRMQRLPVGTLRRAHALDEAETLLLESEIPEHDRERELATLHNSRAGFESELAALRERWTALFV